MQTSLIDVLKYNLSGQLIARFISFGINIYLLRHVDASILGLVNVRMMLLYNTIGFLSREPLRKACLSSDLNVAECVKYAWLSPLLYTAITAFCTTIWWIFPPPEEVLSGGYGMLLVAFAGSALLEGIAEPLAIVSLKTSQNAHFALANSVLNFLQRVFALILLLGGTDAVVAFGTAQVMSSLTYAFIHFHKFAKRSGDAPAWPSQVNDVSYDKHHLKLIGTLLGHSVLKQFITDGAGYVMTFTKVLSLEKQAVYDAVERLGSLVARTILAPLEESAAIFFSSHLRRSNPEKEVSPKVLVTFTGLLRVVVNLGLVACVFGIPYSEIVVRLYGGSLLADNGGGQMLSLYAFYLLCMAVNGITECFAFASMDRSQIFSHGAFLLVTALAHLLLNVVLCSLFGASGFIVANALNMVTRIAYSWRHIGQRMGPQQPSLWQFMPSFTLGVMLAFALFATRISLVLFGSAGGTLHNLAHLAVGGIMFLLVLAHLYQSEDLFTSVLEKIE
ncbi:RFT1 protein [Aphelenchoides avenae]|nr:RFT1 protein [Aphelenchus avenae]